MEYQLTRGKIGEVKKKIEKQKPVTAVGKQGQLSMRKRRKEKKAVYICYGLKRRAIEDVKKSCGVQ